MLDWKQVRMIGFMAGLRTMKLLRIWGSCFLVWRVDEYKKLPVLQKFKKGHWE